jgi:hypothetical protein
MVVLLKFSLQVADVRLMTSQAGSRCEDFIWGVEHTVDAAAVL